MQLNNFHHPPLQKRRSLSNPALQGRSSARPTARGSGQGQGCRRCWGSSPRHGKGTDGCLGLCPEVPDPALGRGPAPRQPAAPAGTLAPAAQPRSTDQPLLPRSPWTRPPETSPGLGPEHRLMARAGPGRLVWRLPAPWSEGLGWSHGQAIHRGSGSLCGAASWQAWGLLLQPQTHPLQRPKGRPGPNHRLAWLTPGRLLCADKRNLPVNDKKPWVLSTFGSNMKPAAPSALGSRHTRLRSSGTPTSPSNNAAAQRLSHFYLHNCTAHFPVTLERGGSETLISHIHELNVSSGKEEETQRVAVGFCRGTCNNSNYRQLQ